MQHDSWLARELPPVEQLRSDLWSVPVPMPGSPLRYVSVYIFADDAHLVLIDAGWESDESWHALCAGVASIGGSMADIQGVLVTHQHFDHLGLARRIREESDAWIGLHPADVKTISRPEFRNPDIALQAERKWLVTVGASRQEAEAVTDDIARFQARSRVAIPDRLIEDGAEFRISRWLLRAVHTPGHTPGHLCFVDENARLLFSGDHVLPRITPNVSADRRAESDTLGNFLASLEKVARYSVDEVLPAHEWRFSGLPARLRRLAEHHEDRLSELLGIVRRMPGLHPWKLAGELTWSRPWDQYDGHMKISGVSETVAHLDHLIRRGLVAAISAPVPTYKAVESVPDICG
jgi:glyoxylase-like metal-dependent hydrolase (beta-lactamase superfamily II)